MSPFPHCVSQQIEKNKIKKVCWKRRKSFSSSSRLFIRALIHSNWGTRRLTTSYATDSERLHTLCLLQEDGVAPRLRRKCFSLKIKPNSPFTFILLDAVLTVVLAVRVSVLGCGFVCWDWTHTSSNNTLVFSQSIDNRLDSFVVVVVVVVFFFFGGGMNSDCRPCF